MLNELVAPSVKAGLQINIKKTKFMSNIPNTKIFLRDVEIEKQVEYIYLGQTISFKNKMNKELEIRRTKAWQGYWYLKQVFKSTLKISAKI